MRSRTPAKGVPFASLQLEYQHTYLGLSFRSRSNTFSDILLPSQISGKSTSVITQRAESKCCRLTVAFTNGMFTSSEPGSPGGRVRLRLELVGTCSERRSAPHLHAHHHQLRHQNKTNLARKYAVEHIQYTSVSYRDCLLGLLLYFSFSVVTQKGHCIAFDFAYISCINVCGEAGEVQISAMWKQIGGNAAPLISSCPKERNITNL